jgi:hypothetical protein
MSIAAVVFWGSVLFVAYAYLGYPVLLRALAAFRSRPVRRAPVTPSIALIITVRNEEARIAEKLANTLALDYPADRLDMIVASDCSDDRTHAIVEAERARGIRLVVSPERRGKEFAQRTAIEASTAEILVFSDVATRLNPDGLRKIAANFADPDVGCVSSVDRVIGADGTVSGEGAYVRYEMLLRALESRVGSVVGLSGSFFAARRVVCEPWSTNLPSDFTTLLNTLKHGLRGISDKESIGYYNDLADEQREYARKVRTISRGINGLRCHLELLNPLVYGLSAWQLFSHKACRWLVPYALMGALVSSLVLARSSTFYLLCAAGQLIAYGLALHGWRRHGRVSSLHRLLTFFVIVNISILHAWANIFRGRTFIVWDPSRR